MTKRERSVRQVLNIGEVVDLDGHGTWATVESWDESSDIYSVINEQTGEGHEYVHPPSNELILEARYGLKAINKAYDVLTELQDEYDSVHDPDYVDRSEGG